MGRLEFDFSGRLISIDGSSKPENKREIKNNLTKSNELEFLKDDDSKFEKIFERAYWNLNVENKEVEPLVFSNGKSQEDIVKEIIDCINRGVKVIFLHGACGTGKSVIALNVARAIGKTSIVVPIKNLQRQYEEDYTRKNYLVKPNGKKMKIAMITGRDNHDSVIEPGCSCADPYLPENIKIIEKNKYKLIEYYNNNPLITNKEIPEIRKMRRLSIAPTNPYWSPILPADFEMKHLNAIKKIRYKGCNGKDYIFYHRKAGCSYYDQYLSYNVADVIIFNSAKYLAEISLGRKPETEIEVIDEGDEFLDGLFEQEEINLTRLGSALNLIYPDSLTAIEIKNKIGDLIELEERNKRALGVDEEKIFEIKETKLKEILELFVKSSEFESEVAIDEGNYANKVLEIARNSIHSMKEAYVVYKRVEENLTAKIVSTDLTSKMTELMNLSKCLIFMTGTVHSKEIIKKVFKINDFEIVEAETLHQGSIDILRTGKEIDCKHSNFTSKKHSRKDYLEALDACLGKAKKPVLVHVNAYKDLPNNFEINEFNLKNLVTAENLMKQQNLDKEGNNVLDFKKGKKDILFSTRCNRGVDFPGEMCNSIIFTKYPNPNVADVFWKILERTHPEYFWEFYKDKANREFLQRIFRAVRSANDKVSILSPDLRVLDEVRKLQQKVLKN